MATARLSDFIGAYREDLIARCRAKVATRSAPPAAAGQIDDGVPQFLDRLVVELRGGPSKTHEIADEARDHGADLRARGFTVAQVVHDYGDICQAVTDLAVEMAAPIATEDFRTLNRCLDDAIASAVTAYSADPSLDHDDDLADTRNLMWTALNAWGAMKAGRVGTRGATGDVLDLCLNALSARLARPRV